MATTVTAGKPETRPEKFAAGHGGGAGRPDGGDGGGRPRRPVPPATHVLGMWLAVAAVAMLFIGLTSAYVVRQGLGSDWKPIPMPRILVLSTVVLLASSFTMEKARRLASVNRTAFHRWLSSTLLLGLTFLAGQIAAWRVLSAQGVYLSSNPHSSFFYLLTGLHGLHLAGGILALAYIFLNVRLRPSDAACAVTASPRLALWISSDRQSHWIEATAIYWHFMDGLWLYLFILLFGLR
jgi:cytochrome c oxidase subunit 3